MNRLYTLVWLAVGIGFLAFMFHSFVPLGTVGHVIESAQTEIEYATGDRVYYVSPLAVSAMYFTPMGDHTPQFDSLEDAKSYVDIKGGHVYECIDSECRGVYP